VELKPETLAAITAAATAFLGKSARVRSARELSANAVGAWARQGRAFVHSSHNPRQRTRGGAMGLRKERAF